MGYAGALGLFLVWFDFVMFWGLIFYLGVYFFGILGFGL